MRRPRLRSLLPAARPAAPAAVAPNMPKNVMDRLRQMLVGLSQMGARRSQDRDVRNLVVGAAKLARNPGQLRNALDGMAEIEAAQIAEASTWLDHTRVAAGEAGRFDACDLRNWLAIAERAGVPAIPARQIASFTSDEYSALVGLYGLDRENKRIARMLDAIRQGVENDYSPEERAEMAANLGDAIPVDLHDAIDRVHSAMDDVPEGWMVRSSVCGGDNLKALAGCGVTETFIPEVRFGPDLEIGPGWVRTGNRRRLDVQDQRTMSLYVRNDTVPIAFLARPWVVATRWIEGRDPHRAGSRLDIPGSWPAEWRAFVRAGKVVGVSAYYPWAGHADVTSAQMALKVRELAQKMADAAVAASQTPRDMDAVLARGNEQIDRALSAFGFNDGDFDCTIDFIESDAYGATDGLLMLEAGPGCGMFGGGHPCGFAGDFTFGEFEGQPARWMACEGVAFRHMSHLLIGEPKTWAPGDKAGAILTWDEVDQLASSTPAAA